MSLVPFSPRRVPTLWTAAPIKLPDVLETARKCGDDRVMLTGAPLPAGYLLGRLPAGWMHGAHHLDHATPVGRYIHASGRRVEVRRAAEWFGEGTYSPAAARAAWDDLAEALAAVVPGAKLLGSPGATGREAWLRSLPRDKDGHTIAPPQVSPEVAELLRATSGQHRIELLPGDGERDLMPELWVMDGRLMYAAMVRELGTAPASFLTADEAGALLTDERGRFARARYRVRATVPAGWHTVGILPFAEPGSESWTYPRTPGATFETWADAAEVVLAADWGWSIEPLEGLRFTPGRPLDTWAARLLRAYDRVDHNKLGVQRSKMVRAGIRWMLLHSVGAWHSSGQTQTTVTASPMERPPGEGWAAPEITKAGAVWRRRVPLDGRAALMAHPEYSAQIWGRARARVLQAPTAVRGEYAGALWVNPASLVSIYGDAVMTTEAPTWAPEQYDDGRPGRLRVKGHLPTPAPWPATGRDRDRLMHQAEKHTKETNR